MRLIPQCRKASHQKTGGTLVRIATYSGINQYRLCYWMGMQELIVYHWAVRFVRQLREVSRGVKESIDAPWASVDANYVKWSPLGTHPI